MGASALGVGWRSVWDRKLDVTPSQILATRADGRQDVFTNNSGVYASDPDVRSVLRQIPATGTPTAYTITTVSDEVETYSPTGKLLSVTTRAGLVTALTYDANHNLTKVTGPFGHALSFTYDVSNRVSSMTAPDGGVYAYAYNAANNLISVSYPGGTKRQYVYENASFPNVLTGIIDEKGVRYATWAYDNLGRAISSQHAGGAELTKVAYNADGSSTITDARGNSAAYGFTTQFGMVKPTGLTGAPMPSLGGKAFTYDANGFLASRADYDGNVTTYTHDARGNQTSRVEASGSPVARTIATTWHPTFHLPTKITEPNRVTAYAYDAHGNLLTMTVTAGALTRTWSFTYNASGQAITTTDPLGHVTTFTNYDGAGRLLRLVDPNGVVTTLTYDPRGRVASRTEAALATRYAYDAAGNLTRVTLPDGSYLAYSYDAAHRLTGVADALGNHIAYTLDAASNRTKEQVFDPSNTLMRTRSYAYDSVNRLNKAIGAAGETTTLNHDAQGNVTSVVDPLAHTTSYSYDALNRLAHSIDPTGGNFALGYDANDHLTSVVDPRNLHTAYGWNGLDEQPSLTSPDTGATTKTLDAAGNVLTSTDARGKTTTYAYDALNRKTRAAFADGTSIVWQYDLGAYGKGRLSKITDVTGSTSYSYDANGHVTQKTQVVGTLTLTTRYAYDAGGRLATITYPSGKAVTYAYDAAGRVNSIKQGAQVLVSGVGYFPFGGAASWTFGNGTTYARSFDQDGRVTGISLPAADMQALTYDAASRITKITDSAIATKTFGYDALDRLTTYAGGTLTQSYGYDHDGNRINASLKNGTTTNAFTYAFTATSNRLASISGAWAESFTYDAAGNTLTHNASSGNYAFAYDARGRLAQATVGALSKVYAINGLGQRVAKTNPANASDKTYFVYDEEGHLIGEYGATGAVIEETVWLRGLPVAMMQATSTYYIAPDHLGAPHQITNAAKAVVWLWDRDPFGNGAPTAATGFAYNLRFPGQYYDAETGLNYNYFRDYDPKTGRYVESDPIGLAGGNNTYVYVRGNPASGVDARGLDSNIPSSLTTAILGNPILEFVGDHPNVGWYLMGGGAALLTGGVAGDLALAGGAETGGQCALASLRQAYIAEVRALEDIGLNSRAAGADLEDTARLLHQLRRELGEQFKNLTPASELEKIYARNIERYNDKLGPTIEWLRAQGKTWEQIINSSARPGGKDLGL